MTDPTDIEQGEDPGIDPGALHGRDNVAGEPVVAPVAAPGDTDPKPWVTYRLANGEAIYGEYAWVDGPEFFDGANTETAVIKETWVLVESETLTFGAGAEDEDPGDTDTLTRPLCVDGELSLTETETRTGTNTTGATA